MVAESVVKPENDNLPEKMPPADPSKEEVGFGDMVRYKSGQDEALQYLNDFRVEYTKEEEAKVRRKIDLYLLPWYAPWP